MKDKNKFSELEGNVINKKGLKVIRILDNQLTEDKELFGILIDYNLVNEEGKKLINDLIIKHTEEFDI